MMTYPKSAYDRAGGVVFLPRMLDKIRLNLENALPMEYHSHLGERMDERCCKFLHVSYDEIVCEVAAGRSDEEIVEWCFAHGRTPDAQEVEMWNSFMRKRGWQEEDPRVTDTLKRFKAESGLGNREDIQTFFDYFDVDEKRKP